MKQTRFTLSGVPSGVISSPNISNQPTSVVYLHSVLSYVVYSFLLDLFFYLCLFTLVLLVSFGC